MINHSVSVCMATYNGIDYIAKQIASILPQLSSSDELVISDDSSSDETVSFIRELNDPRIILLCNQKFKNPIFNFENSLKYATRELIFLSDQDDIWMPDKVRIIRAHLRNYDLIVSDALLINENDTVIGDSFFEIRNSAAGFLKNMYKNSYIGCCMAFNRKILKKALPFPANIPMHDMWLGMIAEVYGKTLFCEDKLVKYRRHLSNASPTATGRSYYTPFDMMKFRYELLKSLSIRYFLGK